LKKKWLALLLTLLFASLTPFAAKAPVLSSSITSDQIIGKLQPPEVTILEENETGITLKVEFFGFQRSQTEEDGLFLDILTIPGCGSTEELGKPTLPKHGKDLEVPFNVDFEIYILETESTDYDDYLVYPVQEPAPEVIDNGFEYPTPPFYIDTEFYNMSDYFYPTMPVEYGPAGTLRDVRILPLEFIAFQYNPVQKMLRFHRSITVRIDYYHGPMMSETRQASQASSPYFESLYSSLVGYEQLATQGVSTREEALETNAGWDFIIVTDVALLDAANSLAARRNAEGLSTHVVTTLDIPGGTADDIKAYIQNAYDTWDPRPSYLLLLGDAELIPTFYQTAHPWGGYPANTLIGTDLYYAIMNGPEAMPPFYSEYWTPDIFYGRIPVDNLAQANLVIDKIFEYEDRQWMCGENTAAVIGQFQDNNDDGFEDRRFILTLEEIRNHLMVEDFKVERLYVTGSGVDPTNYNNGAYDAGLPLPADLLRPAYPWDANAADINNAINDERFVVFHRDHGGSANAGHGNGWGHPHYLDTDVATLNNADHFTVVFSINCETGWFDGETDTFPAISYESLCEAFLRESDGGAVGVTGATRVSYSGHNDAMAKGFVDAIWPNFDLAYGPAVTQLRMGEVLNYGKWYYRQFYGASLTRKVEYEMFHYFGDPTMAFKIPPPRVCVDVDIKPGSWPNPLQLKSKGVLPVAVCGTEDFDVTTIDPETVKLTLEGLGVGVHALRWSYEDVATPYMGEPYGGHDLGRDGYLDLTLKFKTQEVIATLGLDAFDDRDVVILMLTGNLKAEFDGTAIHGQDYIWILHK
jgi:hypothetical protein